MTDDEFCKKDWDGQLKAMWSSGAPGNFSSPPPGPNDPVGQREYRVVAEGQKRRVGAVLWGLIATTEGAVSGFFVTTGRFTRDAMEFRSNPPIKLIDEYQLVRMMFESKPTAGDDDSYRSMCHQCEEIVYHRLRAPRPVRCRNGHEIAPTLNLEQVLSASAPTTGNRRARHRRRRWRR
jgi:uncharacterized protein YneF (UPF0154 family)